MQVMLGQKDEYSPLLYLKFRASVISSLVRPICLRTCSEGMSDGFSSDGLTFDGKNLM